MTEKEEYKDIIALIVHRGGSIQCPISDLNFVSEYTALAESSKERKYERPRIEEGLRGYWLEYETLDCTVQINLDLIYSISVGDGVSRFHFRQIWQASMGTEKCTCEICKKNFLTNKLKNKVCPVCEPIYENAKEFFLKQDVLVMMELIQAQIYLFKKKMISKSHILSKTFKIRDRMEKFQKRDILTDNQYHCPICLKPLDPTRPIAIETEDHGAIVYCKNDHLWERVDGKLISIPYGMERYEELSEEFGRDSTECVSCGKKIPIPSDRVVKSVKCPFCGNRERGVF
jgi:hypothetical protein